MQVQVGNISSKALTLLVIVHLRSPETLSFSASLRRAEAVLLPTVVPTTFKSVYVSPFPNSIDIHDDRCRIVARRLRKSVFAAGVQD